MIWHFCAIHWLDSRRLSKSHDYFSPSLQLLYSYLFYFLLVVRAEQTLAVLAKLSKKVKDPFSKRRQPQIVVKASQKLAEFAVPDITWRPLIAHAHIKQQQLCDEFPIYANEKKVRKWDKSVARCRAEFCNKENILQSECQNERKMMKRKVSARDPASLH